MEQKQEKSDSEFFKEMMAGLFKDEIRKDENANRFAEYENKPLTTGQNVPLNLDQEDFGTLSTMRMTGRFRPYETTGYLSDYAVDQGEPGLFVLEAYDTEEEAKAGHEKWRKILKDSPPDELVETINSPKTLEFSRANGVRVLRKRGSKPKVETPIPKKDSILEEPKFFSDDEINEEVSYFPVDKFGTGVGVGKFASVKKLTRENFIDETIAGMTRVVDAAIERDTGDGVSMNIIRAMVPIPPHLYESIPFLDHYKLEYLLEEKYEGTKVIARPVTQADGEGNGFQIFDVVVAFHRDVEKLPKG